MRCCVELYCAMVLRVVVVCCCVVVMCAVARWCGVGLHDRL